MCASMYEDSKLKMNKIRFKLNRVADQNNNSIYLVVGQIYNL